MRVLVAGAGAIGQWLGARLQAAGHEVTVLVRPRFVAAMRDLHVTGHTDLEVALDAVTEPAGTYDAVFLTCKAHATAELARAVAPCVGDGVLVSLQNGVGNGEKAAMNVPAGQVAVALTSHGVMIEAPGRVHHAGTGVTRVGPLVPERRAAAERASGLLQDAGLDPAWHDDMTPWVWQKAIVNAGINPVAALHGVPNGGLLGDLWPTSRALVEEAVALSRAAGVGLPPGDLVQVTRDVAESTAENKCSMLQDVEAERPTEIEQITGYFVRLGRRLGYPMFASEDVYRAVKALEAAYLGDGASLALTRAQVGPRTGPFDAAAPRKGASSRSRACTRSGPQDLNSWSWHRVEAMGMHATLEAPRTNVFGLAPAYGHVPSPAERRAARRAKALAALRSTGEGLLLVAAVAAWAFLATRR